MHCRISGWKINGVTEWQNTMLPTFRKTNISYPLICTLTCVSRGKKFSFFEKFDVLCFVFLRHPFWDSSFCLITDSLKNKVNEVSRHIKEINIFLIDHSNSIKQRNVKTPQLWKQVHFSVRHFSILFQIFLIDRFSISSLQIAQKV